MALIEFYKTATNCLTSELREHWENYDHSRPRWQIYAAVMLIVVTTSVQWLVRLTHNVPQPNPAIFTPAVTSQHSYPHPGPPWVLIEFLHCLVMYDWGGHTTLRFMSRGKVKGTCNSGGKMLCSKFNGNPSVPITPYWSITHHHDRWRWWEWFPQARMHKKVAVRQPVAPLPCAGQELQLLTAHKSMCTISAESSTSLKLYPWHGIT